jgi:hypothetical protein
MSDTTEIQVEELKAELRNLCGGPERQRIQLELDLAKAEVALLIGEQIGEIDPDPPF